MRSSRTGIAYDPCLPARRGFLLPLSFGLGDQCRQIHSENARNALRDIEPRPALAAFEESNVGSVYVGFRGERFLGEALGKPVPTDH